jgi:hypothetical protein
MILDNDYHPIVAFVLGMGLELFARRKNQTLFPAEISVSPLETEEGTLISGAIRDITDRKRREEHIQGMNQQLTKRSGELEAINKELKAFAYSISHDLRLTSPIWWATPSCCKRALRRRSTIRAAAT